MDQRERADEAQEALLAALDGRQAALWTALPGEIQAFDADGMVCTVQPAIQARYRGKDGAEQLIDMPLLLDCPVQFPAGGDATLTFPVRKGDECLVVFACRCIDGWWQSGGIQPPIVHRMHSLSDGFALLGFRSKPRKLEDISASAVELRADDGTTKVSLDPAAQTVAIRAPGGITLDGPVTATSTVQAADTISSDVDVVANGVSGHDHTHGGVTAGSGDTGAPN